MTLRKNNYSHQTNKKRLTSLKAVSGCARNAEDGDEFLEKISIDFRIQCRSGHESRASAGDAGLDSLVFQNVLVPAKFGNVNRATREYENHNLPVVSVLLPFPNRFVVVGYARSRLVP